MDTSIDPSAYKKSDTQIPCVDGSRVIDEPAVQEVLKAEAKGVRNAAIRSTKHALLAMAPDTDNKINKMYRSIYKMVREMIPSASSEDQKIMMLRIMKDMGFDESMMNNGRKEEEDDISLVRSMFSTSKDSELDSQIVRFVTSKNARLSLIQWLSRAAASSCQSRGAATLHGMNVASSLILLLQKLPADDVTLESMELVWKLFLGQSGSSPEVVDRVLRVLQGVDIRMQTAGPMMW